MRRTNYVTGHYPYFAKGGMVGLTPEQARRMVAMNNVSSNFSRHMNYPGLNPTAYNRAYGGPLYNVDAREINRGYGFNREANRLRGGGSMYTYQSNEGQMMPPEQMMAQQMPPDQMQMQGPPPGAQGQQGNPAQAGLDPNVVMDEAMGMPIEQLQQAIEQIEMQLEQDKDNKDLLMIYEILNAALEKKMAEEQEMAQVQGQGQEGMPPDAAMQQQMMAQQGMQGGPPMQGGQGPSPEEMAMMEQQMMAQGGGGQQMPPMAKGGAMPSWLYKARGNAMKRKMRGGGRMNMPRYQTNTSLSTGDKMQMIGSQMGTFDKAKRIGDPRKEKAFYDAGKINQMNADSVAKKIQQGYTRDQILNDSTLTTPKYQTNRAEFKAVDMPQDNLATRPQRRRTKADDKRAYLDLIQRSNKELNVYNPMQAMPAMPKGGRKRASDIINKRRGGGNILRYQTDDPYGDRLKYTGQTQMPLDSIRLKAGDKMQMAGQGVGTLQPFKGRVMPDSMQIDMQRFQDVSKKLQDPNWRAKEKAAKESFDKFRQNINTMERDSMERLAGGGAIPVKHSRVNTEPRGGRQLNNWNGISGYGVAQTPITFAQTGGNLTKYQNNNWGTDYRTGKPLKSFDELSPEGRKEMERQKWNWEDSRNPDRYGHERRSDRDSMLKAGIHPELVDISQGYWGGENMERPTYVDRDLGRQETSDFYKTPISEFEKRRGGSMYQTGGNLSIEQPTSHSRYRNEFRTYGQKYQVGGEIPLGKLANMSLDQSMTDPHLALRQRQMYENLVRQGFTMEQIRSMMAGGYPMMAMGGQMPKKKRRKRKPTFKMMMGGKMKTKKRGSSAPY